MFMLHTFLRLQLGEERSAESQDEQTQQKCVTWRSSLQLHKLRVPVPRAGLPGYRDCTVLLTYVPPSTFQAKLWW
jgi:hypothetical protein